MDFTTLFCTDSLLHRETRDPSCVRDNALRGAGDRDMDRPGEVVNHEICYSRKQRNKRTSSVSVSFNVFENKVYRMIVDATVV